MQNIKLFVPPNKYRDAIDQVHAYNARLLTERKLRMPYIDGQTGVAQQDCHLWVSRVVRSAPVREGQICSYPSRRWRVLKRPDFTGIQKQAEKQKLEKHASVSTSGSENVTKAVEVGQEDISLASSSHSFRDESSNLTENDSGSAYESSQNTYNQISDDYGIDDSPPDYVDSDDEFQPSGKRKRKPASVKKERGKKNALALKLANKVRNIVKEELMRMTPEERKKPYLCEICGKRYKNQQGLRYHYEHFNHDEEDADMNEDSQQSLPTSVSEPRPKRNKGPGPASPNIYCDFCLGDSGENKKTGTAEKLISCADCGRSGHPSCLQFTDQLMKEVQKYKWQCIECKSCSLCGTSDNDDQLLFCDECDRGYHMYCLTPRMHEPPEGHWCCRLCEERQKREAEEINNPGQVQQGPEQPQPQPEQQQQEPRPQPLQDEQPQQQQQKEAQELEQKQEPQKQQETEAEGNEEKEEGKS